MKSTFLTRIISSKKKYDIMVCDIPNAFFQAEIPEPEKGKKHIIMNTIGMLVDLIVEVIPDIPSGTIMYKKGQNIIYVQML